MPLRLASFSATRNKNKPIEKYTKPLIKAKIKVIKFKFSPLAIKLRSKPAPGVIGIKSAKYLGVPVQVSVGIVNKNNSGNKNKGSNCCTRLKSKEIEPIIKAKPYAPNNTEIKGKTNNGGKYRLLPVSKIIIKRIRTIFNTSKVK